MKKILCFVLVFIVALTTIVVALPKIPAVVCEECGSGLLDMTTEYYNSPDDDIIDVEYTNWVIERMVGSRYLCNRTVRKLYMCSYCGHYGVLSYTEKAYFYPYELPDYLK